MKKTITVGLVLCALLNLAIISVPASACIGPDGKPVEGTDGSVTNCVTITEEPELDPFIVDVSKIDFGYFSEVGRTYTQTFTIENNSDQTVAIKLSADKPEDEGLADENKLGTEWIAFVGGVKYFEIAPKSSKTIGVRAVVPADAKVGSQYAIITVENTTLNETHEIKVSMTVATEGLAFGGKVAKSDVTAFSLDDKVHASAVVKNEGNAGFEAKYSVRAVAKFGSNLTEWTDIVKEETAMVYPNSEKTFTVSDDAATLGYGLFTVEQKVVYVNEKGEQIEEVSTRTVLNLPIWVLIVAASVVVLAIVITIIVKVVREKKYGKDEEDWDDEEGEEEDHPKKAKKAAKKAAKAEKKAEKKHAKAEAKKDKKAKKTKKSDDAEEDEE